MRLEQTLGPASAPHVVVRVQMRGPAGTEVRECRSAEFELSDRGVTMGTVVVPWHRVLRYDTIVEQPIMPEEDGREGSGTLQRVVFEDDAGEVRSIEVPISRYEAGPWTLTVVMERELDRRRGTASTRKVHIPWGRVVESERVFKVPEVDEVGPPAAARPAPDPRVRAWFEQAEPSGQGPATQAAEPPLAQPAVGPTVERSS
jgi:alkylated DNA nucleotide flippase Atl1